MIKKYRLGLQITQKDVADFLGYSCAQPVSDMERGKIDLPMKYWRKVAEFLEIPIEEIKLAYIENIKNQLNEKFEEEDAPMGRVDFVTVEKEPNNWVPAIIIHDEIWGDIIFECINRKFTQPADAHDIILASYTALTAPRRDLKYFRNGVQYNEDAN